MGIEPTTSGLDLPSPRRPDLTWPDMSPRCNRKPAFGQRSTSKKHVTSMSCTLEPAICSRDTGQQIPCFDRCQLIITKLSNSIKEVNGKRINQGCMSLSTYYLEYGRNRPRSIYQYSSMAPRLSGQNCKFFKFLLSLNSHRRLGYKENNTKFRR